MFCLDGELKKIMLCSVFVRIKKGVSMAKSKIEYEWIEDFKERMCLKVSRKKGKLSWDEVMEVLHDSGKFEGRYFIQEFHIMSELPTDMFEDGDVWYLYELDDYLGKNWIDRLLPQKLLFTSKTEFGKITGICPTCGKEIVQKTEKINYCASCGQEIVWTES